MSVERLRAAYAALQGGDFTAASRLAAPLRAELAGALIHGLADAMLHGPEPAAAALARIAAENPRNRHPVLDVVDLLHANGRGRDILPHLEAALRLRPHDTAVQAALGVAHADHGSPEAAITLFRASTVREPDEARHWSNLAKVLSAAGQDAAAAAAFGTALRLAPGDPQFALNAAIARMRAGDMPGAWPGFRARHTLPGRTPAPPGPELSTVAEARGRTVLLLHDEGFGDTVQFIRYAFLLQDAGAAVRISAPPPLHRLLRDSGLALADAAASYDAWCRIPDLPGVFGTTPATIPAALPYLVADPARAASWAARLPPGRRVGLVWAGAARPHDPAATITDRQRSIPRGALPPLLATPGITWISLQLGEPPPPGVFDATPGMVDFADTAAIVAGLDAVVSVDTAAAHVAGALGRRTLLLDRFDNCWRWFRGRDDSPWYPGAVEIIRQDRPGDWDGVLHRAAAALRRQR